ncbi:MAG: hypothetical protein ACK5NG_02145 [Chthoniobacterales bacterium]
MLRKQPLGKIAEKVYYLFMAATKRTAKSASKKPRKSTSKASAKKAPAKKKSAAKKASPKSVEKVVEESVISLIDQAASILRDVVNKGSKTTAKVRSQAHKKAHQLLDDGTFQIRKALDKLPK